MPSLSPASVDSAASKTGGKRRAGPTMKALKRTLKKAGMKMSGKKATLKARVKKAHLKVGGGEEMEGGVDEMETVTAEETVAPVGARRRSRKGLVGRTLKSVGSVGRSIFGRGK